MMSGGAPLSPSTHEYLRAVLGVDLLQVVIMVIVVMVIVIIVKVIMAIDKKLELQDFNRHQPGLWFDGDLRLRLNHPL